MAAAVSVGTVSAPPPDACGARSAPRGGSSVVLLVSIAALYPVLAARAKIDDRFDTSVGRTLDGTAFMTKAVFTDKA